MTRSRDLERKLGPLLAVTAPGSAVLGDWRELPGRLGDDGRLLLLIDDKRLEDTDAPAVLAQAARDRDAEVAMVCDPSPPDWLGNLLRDGVRHFLARRAPALEADVLCMLAKLDEPRLGLGPHLRFGAAVVETPLVELDETLDRVEAWAARATRSERVARMAREITDELVGNALRHASAGSSGSREAIRVTHGFDGARLGVAVSDDFGALSEATLVTTLAGCLDQSPAATDYVGRARGPVVVDADAGGRGLYSVFERLGDLVVNLVPGQRTEVVGVLDAAGGPIARGNEHRALHVYRYGGVRRGGS